jgi:hypothetical protein
VFENHDHVFVEYAGMEIQMHHEIPDPIEGFHLKVYDEDFDFLKKIFVVDS